MLLHRIAILASFVVSGAASVAGAGEIVLAESGKSPYRIVVAQDASPSVQHAGEELQKYLKEISGADIPIVSDRQSSGPHEIVLGDNAHLRALDTNIDIASLGKEGYVIRTVGDGCLVIAGSAVRGTLYGVYGLLEDHLGCHWFAPDASVIPKMSRLVLGEINDQQIPVLEHREPFLVDCQDPEWCAHNRMNSSSVNLTERQGGRFVAFGTSVIPYVHSFFSLVPPKQYFDSHPEYFSMIGGKRVKEDCQLCCTNPDVVRICTERVREAMRKDTAATAFSVSQQDCHPYQFSTSLNRWVSYCECPNCQALAVQEESQAAPVLYLVNRVAEAVEKEFPDKAVETLAYQWSRKPPKHMRPRSNVVIRLCSFECCFAHPMATCDHEKTATFRADLEGWAKVAQRLWIWDYCTDFANYLLPFPNQTVIGPNIRFFAEHGVKGIFEQDSYQSAESELASLSGYIMTKCLWNPNYDADRAINDFLKGYYGKAAAPIRTYIDALHDRVERENIHVGIYAEPDSPHLTDELLVKADQWWQQAEDLVADDPAVLHRVKIGRLSVDYAILTRARIGALAKQPTTEPFHSLVTARFQPFFDVLAASKFDTFFEDCTGKRDGKLDKAAYRRDLAKDLQIRE